MTSFIMNFPSVPIFRPLLTPATTGLPFDIMNYNWYKSLTLKSLSVDKARNFPMAVVVGTDEGRERTEIERRTDA